MERVKKAANNLTKRVKSMTIYDALEVLFPDPTRLLSPDRPYHPIIFILSLALVYAFVFSVIVPLKLHWVIISVISAILMHLIFTYGAVWWLVIITISIDIIINSIIMPAKFKR